MSAGASISLLCLECSWFWAEGKAGGAREGRAALPSTVGHQAAVPLSPTESQWETHSIRIIVTAMNPLLTAPFCFILGHPDLWFWVVFWPKHDDECLGFSV